MMEGNMRAKATKYPRLFSGTYWSVGNDLPHPDIVANRNTFAETYRLKRRVKCPARITEAEIALRNMGKGHILDHTEYYKVEGGSGVLMVTSPYWAPGEGWKDVDDQAPKGWTQIPNIYSKQGSSFVMYFPNTRSGKNDYALSQDLSSSLNSGDDLRCT